MEIESRRQEDMTACLRLLADVHARDRYPLHWPADPGSWLTPHGLRMAWVAAALRGHVGICSADGNSAAPIWSAACGLPPYRLAVVSRLFVDHRFRGCGFGTALLAHACAWAGRMSLQPVLEVLSRDHAAITLYERLGWHHIADAPAPWSGDGSAVRYYLGPR